MMRLSRRLGIGRLAALLLGVTLLALPPTAADGVVRHASGDRSPLGHPAARVRPAAIPNPSSNEAPIPPGGTGCTNYGLDFLLASPDDSAACVAGALAAIDNSRANEHLAPLSFDINTFEAMPATEQIFAITNLERTSRGLRAAEFMTAQLDRASQSGANSSSDPTFPASLTGGAVPVSTSSNWQGGDSNVLWADDTWMYDDGFGSSNADCTSPSSSGCWVHRQDTLTPNPQPGCYLAMGAASKGLSFADMVVEGCGPTPTDVVLDWPTVERALAGNGQFAISTQALVAPDSFASSYSSWLEVKNATGPLSWTVVAGRLPPGFALTSSGNLTGPPTALSGKFTFTVKVTEASAPPQSGIGTFALDFLPDGLPAAPSDVVATASNGSAAISWTPANSRGGPSVIGYTVSESYSGPHGCETNSASATSCVVSGLTNGQPYVFTVSASNAAGTSADSTPSDVVWPGSPTAGPLVRPVVSVRTTRLHLRTSTRTIALSLECSVRSCSGVLKLVAVVPLASSVAASSASTALEAGQRTRSVVLASARYRLQRGHRGRVELVATSAGLAHLLGASAASPLRAVVTVTLSHGATSRLNVEVT